MSSLLKNQNKNIQKRNLRSKHNANGVSSSLPQVKKTYIKSNSKILSINDKPSKRYNLNSKSRALSNFSDINNFSRSKSRILDSFKKDTHNNKSNKRASALSIGFLKRYPKDQNFSSFDFLDTILSFLYNSSRLLYNEVRSISLNAIACILSAVLLIVAFWNLDAKTSFSFLDSFIPSKQIDLIDSDILTYDFEVINDRDFQSNAATVVELEPPKEISHIDYEVKSGDNFSVIANEHNIITGTILSYNGIESDPTLIPGQIIKIPNQNGISYSVKAGDTVEALAAEHGISHFTIYDVNNLKSDALEVGMVLFLPGAYMDQDSYLKASGEELDYFLFPVNGYRITSGFGYRPNPFTNSGREYHSGVDLAASGFGHPILASKGGIVTQIVRGNSTYGNFIVIDHGQGYKTKYSHLNKILVTLGERVIQSSKIAEMGSTGRSTGPHLDFQILINNNPVDPLKYLRNR